MPSDRPRILCVGHVNWDVTLRVDRLPEPDGEVVLEERLQRGGGSAANVAGGLADLGVGASLFGSVGDDDAGAMALSELRSAGVDADAVRVVDGATAVKYLLVDGGGEVMVLAGAGANEAFAAADLPESTLAAVDHLHLTSQAPATAADLAARATAVGVPVSFDPGRQVDDREYAPVVRDVDLLFLNEREAAALAGSAELDALPENAAVVCKRGADGAELRGPDGVVDHPGFDVTALDTTGAGDAFAAGFLASRYAEGASDERTLAVANACGALGARETGARTDLDWSAVASLIEG